MAEVAPHDPTAARTSASRSYLMSRVKGRDTKPEMVVRRLLHGMGYRFRLQAKELPGRPDIVFRPRRKAIFVHGCFWHRHRRPDCRRGRSTPASRTEYWEAKFARNVTRDRRNERALRAAGWGVMVVWECQTKPAGLDRLAGRLRRFLG